MWIFVLFDLPTLSKKQKYEYTQFRKRLLGLGFTMQQYSVYSCFCGSRERMQVQIARLQRNLPPEGSVMILNMTDRQFSEIINFYCKSEKQLNPGPQQLEMF